MGITVSGFKDGINGQISDSSVQGIKSNTKKARAKNNSSNCFFAGDILSQNDKIKNKRMEAQKKALKIVRQAWDQDKDTDNLVKETKQHYEEKFQEISEMQEKINDNTSKQNDLKDLYGIDENSQEYKDTLLLMKHQDCFSGVSNSQLTEDEQKRYDEISKNPLTEYQTRMLELNGTTGGYKKQMEKAKEEMIQDVSNINQIKLERLKSHGMVDAAGAAEDIMDAANKEIIGMIIGDAKDEIDKKAEESKEESQKTKQDKEEKEKQLEKQKQERAIQQAIATGDEEDIRKAQQIERENKKQDINTDDVMKTMMGSSYDSSDVKSSLDDIKNSMNLLEADLKGIKVNQEV